IEPNACSVSRDHKLSHVRDVEHAGGISHGLMFVDDAAVLHRHDPSAERHHPRTQSNVLVVKRRFLVGGVRHPAKLDGDNGGASLSEECRAKTGGWREFQVPCDLFYFATETVALLFKT